MGLGVVFFVFYATALTNMRKSHGIANDYFNSFGLPLLSAKYRTAVHTIDEHKLEPRTSSMHRLCRSIHSRPHKLHTQTICTNNTETRGDR